MMVAGGWKIRVDQELKMVKNICKNLPVYQVFRP
jgi:hypothetical protein